MLEVQLSDIVAQLGGELLGDGAIAVDRLGPLDTATSTTIGFIANPRYRSQLAGSAAACVIVASALRDEAAARGAAIVVSEPYLYYARLTQWWAARSRPSEPGGVHSTAVVEPGAVVHASVHVGPLAFVGAGARLSEGVVIGAQAHVGRDAVIGARSRLATRSVVGDGCVIGERCILQPGAIIGADGFGFAPSSDGWQKIEQLGIVRIGDDVEVGANTCIDRGALDDTVIEDGVKLDNLIQIAHNVHIGRHTVMAGCSAVAGSARIGAHCQIGGAARILGHLQLVDHVIITVATVVTRSILQPGQYSGAFPFDDNARWEKNAATLRHLHDLRGRLRALEKKSAGST